MVTSSSWLAASWRTSSSSSGLTKRMSATVASNLSATCRASASCTPNTRKATLPAWPWRRITPLPISSGVSSGSIVAFGPVPRG
ncbi:hypothetical protein D3C80_1988760 [compost metagenome]